MSLYCGIPFVTPAVFTAPFRMDSIRTMMVKSQFLTALGRDIEDMKTIVESYGLTVDTSIWGRYSDGIRGRRLSPSSKTAVYTCS